MEMDLKSIGPETLDSLHEEQFFDMVVLTSDSKFKVLASSPAGCLDFLLTGHLET